MRSLTCRQELALLALSDEPQIFSDILAKTDDNLVWMRLLQLIANGLVESTKISTPGSQSSCLAWFLTQDGQELKGILTGTIKMREWGPVW